MKRIIALCCSTILLLGVLAACSSNESSSNEKKDGKLTISWFDGTWENPVPEPGFENIKMVNEKFDIDFKPQYIPFDLYTDKLAVKMSSGDLPDVIGDETAGVNFVKWSKQGAFLPLNDYIDKYESLKAIPQSVWDTVTVEGDIYAIPLFFPASGGKKPIIRQDWLDKLGLEMPTNFEELKEVAIAFATQDPDGNGKDDTIGLGLAKGLVYDPSFGAYWSNNTWYHKNDEGKLIPGQISEGSKEKISALKELSDAGALDKDWAVKPYNEVFKDFTAGKVGIWYEQPGKDKGAQPANFDYATLKKSNPDAKIAAMPAFVAPDGTQGYVAGSGYYRVWMLNAKLKDNPEKVEKILEMIDYITQYVPADEQNPDNEYFDWTMGGEGKGYTMVDGAPELTEDYSQYAPQALFNQKQGGWIEGEKSMLDYAIQSKAPEAKEFNTLMVEMLLESNFYLSPVGRIHSEVYNDKIAELNEFATNELTKMVAGQRPISEWDKFVEEYMAKGGADVVNDVNQLLTEANIEGEWVSPSK
ncbi:extracellular solute-binding protein [Fredinandcohnia aciditolerans]|uniref:extracellular solute-binding protein n=1 Tax=Ferdinandcohnia sp. SAFN-114 TaxID=3387275 RepID=UPI000EB4EA96